MKNSIVIYFLIISFSYSLFSCDDYEENTTPKVEQFTLQAIGTATGLPVQTKIDGIDLEVTGNAFTMDFFNKQTGERIGSVTDINVTAETFDDGSMIGENYTVFTFDEDNSTLVLHNFIEMTPIDSVTMEAVIKKENTKTNLIGGTGRFANENGGSTLNAVLDMSEFAKGIVGFNCTYSISIKI